MQLFVHWNIWNFRIKGLVAIKLYLCSLSLPLRSGKISVFSHQVSCQKPCEKKRLWIQSQSRSSFLFPLPSSFHRVGSSHHTPVTGQTQSTCNCGAKYHRMLSQPLDGQIIFFWKPFYWQLTPRKQLRSQPGASGKTPLSCAKISLSQRWQSAGNLIIRVFIHLV